MMLNNINKNYRKKEVIKMHKLDALMTTLSFRAKGTIEDAKAKVKSAVTSKQRGDSQLVVALLLIVVAVGLCFIFREQVTKIISNVATEVSNAITDLSKDTTKPTPTPTPGT